MPAGAHPTWCPSRHLIYGTTSHCVLGRDSSRHPQNMSLYSCFDIFGVPEELASDGGPKSMVDATNDSLSQWGVQHQISSAYHPQSNGRARMAVNTAKHLMQSNITPIGALDGHSDCCISPAQIIFGRQLHDAISFDNCLEKYSNPSVCPEGDCTSCLFREILRMFKSTLSPIVLKAGDCCFIQNQVDTSLGCWDRTGTVVEALNCDKYHSNVDGSGHITMWNR